MVRGGAPTTCSPRDNGSGSGLRCACECARKTTASSEGTGRKLADQILPGVESQTVGTSYITGGGEAQGHIAKGVGA